MINFVAPDSFNNRRRSRWGIRHLSAFLQAVAPAGFTDMSFFSDWRGSRNGKYFAGT